MHVNNMDRAIKDLAIYLKNNQEARLRTVFRYMRGRKDLEMYGDWPILSQIAHTVLEILNKSYTKKEIAEVCRLSSDPELQKQRTDSKLVAILSNKEELKRR